MNLDKFLKIAQPIIEAAAVFVPLNAGNVVSRNDFIYRINSDFSDREDVLKVYNWVDDCRNKTIDKKSYREVNVSSLEEKEVDFAKLDTYVNLFETVYVIRRTVKMKNLDMLFQQRFLSFMNNPYVQREILFKNFTSNQNVFLLYDKWLKFPYGRLENNSLKLAEYLGGYACGQYEYSFDPGKELKKIEIMIRNRYLYKYLRKYVWNICNPKCRYGYYSLERKKKEKKPENGQQVSPTTEQVTLGSVEKTTKSSEKEDYVIRIIRSSYHDFDDICKLQEKACKENNEKHWYEMSKKEEIKDFLKCDDCIPIQIEDDSKIVAFAVVILNPQDRYRYSRYAGDEYMNNRGKEAVLETVFVDEDSRGCGMQSLLIDILCHLARMRKAETVWTTVHPENVHSSKNFEKNDFKMVAENVEVEGIVDVRNIYRRDISDLDMNNEETGEYYIYPLKQKDDEQKDDEQKDPNYASSWYRASFSLIAEMKKITKKLFK